MKIRDLKSIIVISLFFIINIVIVSFSYTQKPIMSSAAKTAKSMAPEFTQIEDLEYFHSKDGIPEMSLSADLMKSQGEEFAEFSYPKGVYNYEAKKLTIKYQAEVGTYEKKNDLLVLEKNVKVSSPEADYLADDIKYFFKKDLIVGTSNVEFFGKDLKTGDKVEVKSERMRAHPNAQTSVFEGKVRGEIQRKKKYEGKMIFSSETLNLDGPSSLAHLETDVRMNRQDYLITAGKADIYLENYNKSLKYFVMNDDVKMTETLRGPEGITHRKAFAERLEGFGAEQKMVLSGAPRVETGTDVIKGYRITFRESADLLEVEDSMSDVQVKKKKAKE
jgi:lipopolysaccharide export system protein LptA